jgi:type VI protein secretion system component Hcp
MGWYAKFDGIDGSSKHKDHGGWCIVNVATAGLLGSPDLNVTNQRPSIEPVSLNVVIDKSLTNLAMAAHHNQVFPKVELHGTKTFGNVGDQTYVALILENARIMYFLMAAHDDKTKPEVVVLRLVFKKYTWQYFDFGEDGTLIGNFEFIFEVVPP